jgi:hypothetical protein
MRELLQHLDPDYYRSALLMVARGELEQLRQERSIGAEVQMSRKIPPCAPRAADIAAHRKVTLGRQRFGALPENH